MQQEECRVKFILAATWSVHVAGVRLEVHALWCVQAKKKVCQKWDSNPRTDTCTRIPMHRQLAFLQTKVALESGALDRSAILTTGFNAGFQRVYFKI